MKYPDNIKELDKLSVDYIGFIFYEKSPRYAGLLSSLDLNQSLTKGKKRVGVFVNADRDFVLQTIDKYSLNVVQLHGNENTDMVQSLKKHAVVFKAFSISEVDDLKKTESYNGVADYFLFDTKTSQHGGSGQKFDWSILEHYKGNTPFWLSGGISVEDVDEIKEINHPKLFGVDINSRFELEPGSKDIQLLKQFIKEIKL
ncbi:phosphoribosylanthranilate isomerase [Dysgonomonas sp. 216]|nr:phosphoribosylanthranilate isomerase [Dysgonomonas sp. 216]